MKDIFKFFKKKDITLRFEDKEDVFKIMSMKRVSDYRILKSSNRTLHNAQRVNSRERKLKMTRS